MLYLVRHAQPAPSPEVTPDEWPLTPEGGAAAKRLMEQLPSDALFVASAERKAWETLPGVEVRRDARLNEVARPDERWSDDFRTRRRAWVEGSVIPGWETMRGAAERFEAAVHDAQPSAAGRPVVIASHGMVITSWLVHRELVAPGDAGGYWEALSFPDCLIIGDGGVERLPTR